jgi:transposase-like protein
MRNRVQIRYSACFRQRVISELESGRFASAEAARVHYGIGGSSTIDKWLRRYGRNHLRAKVVIVQVPDEIDQLKALRQQVAELERALGRTQAQSVLNRSYLELACEELGQDVEVFIKKGDGRRCIGPPGPAAKMARG